MVICSRRSMIFQTWKLFSKSMHEFNEMPKGSCNWPQSTNLNTLFLTFHPRGSFNKLYLLWLREIICHDIALCMFSFWLYCKLCKLKYQMNENIHRNINQVNCFKHIFQLWNSYLCIRRKIEYFKNRLVFSFVWTNYMSLSNV